VVGNSTKERRENNKVDTNKLKVNSVLNRFFIKELRNQVLDQGVTLRELALFFDLITLKLHWYKGSSEVLCEAVGGKTSGHGYGDFIGTFFAKPEEICTLVEGLMLAGVGKSPSTKVVLDQLCEKMVDVVGNAVLQSNREAREERSIAVYRCKWLLRICNGLEALNNYPGTEKFRYFVLSCINECCQMMTPSVHVKYQIRLLRYLVVNESSNKPPWTAQSLLPWQRTLNQITDEALLHDQETISVDTLCTNLGIEKQDLATAFGTLIVSVIVEGTESQREWLHSEAETSLSSFIQKWAQPVWKEYEMQNANSFRCSDIGRIMYNIVSIVGSEAGMVVGLPGEEPETIYHNFMVELPTAEEEEGEEEICEEKRALQIVVVGEEGEDKMRIRHLASLGFPYIVISRTKFAKLKSNTLRKSMIKKFFLEL